MMSMVPVKSMVRVKSMVPVMPGDRSSDDDADNVGGFSEAGGVDGFSEAGEPSIGR